MSNAHLEIIIPATADTQSAIGTVLGPFCESDEINEINAHQFFDRWEIGGSWAGHKMITAIGEDDINVFRAWCRTQNIRLDQHARHRRSAAKKREQVNAKWSEMYPDWAGPCPLISRHGPLHSQHGPLRGDICRVSEIPDGLTADRVIIAEPATEPGQFVAATMLTQQIWNGVDWQATTWDGFVSSALQLHGPVKPDWLCVTVHYHW